MIVDTASLLERESRKALQLLQGLKGTRLIIPRMGNDFHTSSLLHYLLCFKMKNCLFSQM